MKFKKMCFVFILPILFMPFITPNVIASESLGPLYDENGARNARYDHDAKPIIKHLPLRKSDTRTTYTKTGGKVTSNSWLSKPEGGSGHYDYQVSTNYDKTDHENIKCTWFGEVTGKNTSFSIGLESITIGLSESTQKTEERYWENTRSQQDASYRADGFATGDWSSVAIENRSRVYGGAVGKQGAEVSSRANYKKAF